MIIDAHTHIYPDSVAQRAIRTIIDNTKGQLDAYTDGTYNNLIHSMDKAGVDFSIVLTVATNPSQGIGILQWIQKMRERSKRLLYFGSVHPYDSNYKELLREIKLIGLQGIKFHPAYQDFPVDSKDAYKVYEEALKNDLVLHFHSGFDMSLPHCDYTSVERFSKFVNDFKGSKIILAHAGGDNEWEKVMDLLGGKQCYFDIAFVLENMKRSGQAKELYRQNDDYFVFGTDSPWRDQQHYVELIRASVTMNDEQKEKMFYKNIQKLIRFSQE